ncbi:MAG: glycine--tRNA ligase subunit beta, partial [Candidatus Geothermincolia bacterium]
YSEALRRAGVIAGEEERRAMVVSGLEAAAAGGDKRPVPALLIIDEVTDLTEYPRVLQGNFPGHYLELPREVLVTAMEEHQRYIPVEDSSGKLAPAFLVVHNGDPAAEDIIRAGNERVLRGRLDDALFFFREDTREPLEAKLGRLSHVVFQAELGTLYEKSQRLEKLAAFVSEAAGMREEVGRRAQRAALLCKADLITNMVVELTSLQGTMGAIYARSSGEDEEVARAIFEHYLPRFAGDILPQTDEGSVLAIAEKLDNLVGTFGIGLIPSGSEDPYALRRQGAALFSIIFERGLRLELDALIAEAVTQYELGGHRLRPATPSEVSEFCLQRMRQALLAEGHRHDLVDAVMAWGIADPWNARRRLLALTEAATSDLLAELYTAFERCYNLSRKSEPVAFEEALLVEDAERALQAEGERIAPLLEAELAREDYLAALGVLAQLKPAVDRLFDEVFIMAEDEAVKRNRLALLQRCADLFFEVADLSGVSSV